MKKSSIVKASLCGGVALAIVASAGVPKISSASLNAEQGLAGISITLDKYCATESEDTTEEILDSEVPASSVVSSAAIESQNEYDNLAISTANEFVNIRKKSSTDSRVIGKLYRGAAATVLSNDGEWAKIESGSCVGYVSTDYLAIASEAEAVADTFGTKVATINTTTLKVREKANETSDCLTMVPLGETYEVLNDGDDWVKISIDGEDIKGYVSGDYVEVEMEFDHAISIKEEKAAAREAARKAREEEEARLAEEAARQAAEEAANQSTTTTTNTTSSSTSSSSSSTSSSSTTSSSTSSSSSSTSSTSNSSSSSSSSSSASTASGSGSEVASYALQFVGNPYVYGGTSLTNGADCSGFVMQVYAHFGISLPHSSASQAGYGTRVSLSDAKAGDLVFYANGGSVNHVGIYIGGGQIVNAACRAEGICVKSVNYRTVYCVKRIMN